MNPLYTIAHQLLTLGSDGAPIYSDHFAQLNREVHEQALVLYNAQPGNTPVVEAEQCLSLLIAFNATIYNDGHKQQYIQGILDRSCRVLPNLTPSLLKVRLLVYCYSEVYEEELAEEAHIIINTWPKEDLTPEQVEIIEELANFEENRSSWEVMEDFSR